MEKTFKQISEEKQKKKM